MRTNQGGFKQTCFSTEGFITENQKHRVKRGEEVGGIEMFEKPILLVE